MAETRPKKLLVVGDPAVPTDALASLLRDRYEVSPSSAQEAAGAIRAASVDAIFADAASIASLGHALVNSPFSAILNAIGEGVCLCGASGEIVWANDRFREFDDRLKARIGAACREAATLFGAGGALKTSGARAPSRRIDLQSGDGERLFEVVVAPVAGGATGEGDGLPPVAIDSVVAVALDVTAARRTQLKIDAIDRAGRDLMRLDADSVRKMNAGERLLLLQDKIIQYARELLRFDHFNIRLLDRETGRLDVVMSFGLPQEAMEQELFAGMEGNGISGHVAATGRSYICPDTSNDPLYVQGIDQAGSSLTTPLLLNEQVIGVFNVESAKLCAFTDEDRRFAEIFSRSIAMALHILDLLVVERSTTNEAVSGRVVGEVTEPLDDLATEAEWLREQAAANPEAAPHVDRILRDVDSIRKRIRDVARGPRTILGADRAMRDEAVDPALAGRSILIADDEEAIRDTLCDVLRRRGCRVVVCRDGAGAIAELEKAALAGDPRRFDLVVSDIKMPDRNGYEVFSAAKKLDRELPVILMTGFGYDPHHSIVRASQEGLQCVLFKPFQVERLMDEVRRALGAERSAAK